MWTIYQLFLQSSFPSCLCAFSFVVVGRMVEGGGVWVDPVLFEQVGCGLSPEHICMYVYICVCIYIYMLASQVEGNKVPLFNRRKGKRFRRICPQESYPQNSYLP